MKKKIKMWLIYPVVGFAAFFILLGFLVLSALVSKESVRENFKESAEFLMEYAQFHKVEEDVLSSRIDRYADSILLNISYSFNSENPLKSVMWSKYYYNEKNYEKRNLKIKVAEDLEPNKQYLRYWHGSAGIIRILHLILNLKQIYILNGCLFFALTGLLIYKLFKNKFIIEAVLYIVSLIAVSVWYVPFSLEYTWCFLCMAVVSLITVSLAKKEKYAHIGIVFLLSGIVTIFLDFLSTETITLLIPLLLVLRIRGSQIQYTDRKEQFENEFVFILKNSFLWLAGYVFMWVAKWLTASIVLGENVMPYVTEHIEERLAGEVSTASGISYFFQSIGENLKVLFPIDHGLGGWIVFTILVLIICYLCFVYRRKKVEWNSILLYAICGMIPIIRFMVLRNHSTLHYFFTFRALISSVFAVLLSMTKVIDLDKLLKKKKRGKK